MFLWGLVSQCGFRWPRIVREKRYVGGADAAKAVGLVGAMGAAVTGQMDWTGTTKKRPKAGLMHGLLNVTATGLYASEGDLPEDCTVLSPWYGSVFSLKDGSGVDGFATEPQPKFDLRIKNGEIEAI